MCWGKIKLYFEKTEYFRIASAAECSTGIFNKVNLDTGDTGEPHSSGTDAKAII